MFEDVMSSCSCGGNLNRTYAEVSSCGGNLNSCRKDLSPSCHRVEEI